MTYWTSLKEKLQSLNLFENEKKERDSINIQKISTYIFFVLLLLSILALLIYTSQNSISKIAKVERPDFALYQYLQFKYPNTLVCPCTNILNEYNKFIVSFTPKFNQICSSDFVKDESLNYVNYRPFNNKKYKKYNDFRYIGYSFFEMLKTLCNIASQIINDQLVEFYSTTLLSETVYSLSSVNATINAARDVFIATTENQLLLALHILSDIEEGSPAINQLNSNYIIDTFYVTYDNGTNY
ncbi:unnamed protein product [Adineta ricciae]|uniref:Uncharacterized protein n=1 Tax=Adineta ricciae TaxID=249248 RepID=A0A816GL83_ADIRI|nr:unnamed protein product [Adineta ricciae]CAF1674899.1 unnamed protein product [Adineta ricciae]